MKNDSRLYILIIILAAISTSLFVSGNFILEELSGSFYELNEQKAALERYHKIAREMSRLSGLPPDREILMPVDGIRVAQIGDTWHDPRGGGRVHEGQDIFADRGTLVRSATDGLVRKVGKSSRGGNHVFITGAGGRRYYYAHLEAVSPLISEGVKVGKNTIIGSVGNSGNATGTPPHLHFGVYTGIGTINPLPLLINRE